VSGKHWHPTDRHRTPRKGGCSHLDTLHGPRQRPPFSKRALRTLFNWGRMPHTKTSEVLWKAVPGVSSTSERVKRVAAMSVDQGILPSQLCAD
jgi:hypothetical protein